MPLARRHWRLLALAAFGAAVFMVAQPTYVGWWTFDTNPGKLWFSPDPRLGTPLWWNDVWAVYGPNHTLAWFRAYHDQPGFMGIWWDGALVAGWWTLAAVAAGGYMLMVNAPLPPVETSERPDRFGELDDLLALGRVSVKQRGVVIGRDGKRPVYHIGDDHAMVVGGSRVSHKSKAYVEPSIVDCPDSLVIFDPKSELFEATADERAKVGPVHRFDVSRSGCAKFNPLQELRGGAMNIADCEMQGQLMTYGMDEHADPFWRAQASLVLAGLVREACVSQARPTYARVVEAWHRVREGQRPPTADKFVQDRISGFLGLEERPRSGVKAQVEMALRFAANPSTMAAVSRSEWHVSTLTKDRDPATVYLTFPPAHRDVHTQVVRLVLQSLFLGLLHHRMETADGSRKRHRVTWILDEFPALGHLPFIEDAMAVAAGYGLKLFLVCQDVHQIEKTYGREESITKNCGHLIFASLSDSGYEHATKLTGTIVMPMRAQHRKLGLWTERRSETASQSRHPVLNPRDARIWTRDHALVIPMVGAQPVWLRKARWYEMACYRGRIRDTRWMQAS